MAFNLFVPLNLKNSYLLAQFTYKHQRLCLKSQAN